MTPEAFEAMKIPLGEGTFPQKNAEKLEFFYGNMVLQSFYMREPAAIRIMRREKCRMLIF